MRIIYTRQKFQLNRLLICPWCGLSNTEQKHKEINVIITYASFDLILVEMSPAGAFLRRVFMGGVNMKNSDLDALFWQIKMSYEHWQKSEIIKPSILTSRIEQYFYVRKQ